MGAAAGIEATSTGAGIVEVAGAAKAGGVATLSSDFVTMDEDVSSSLVGATVDEVSLASATSVAESVLATLATGSEAAFLLFLRLGAALGAEVVGAGAP